MSTFRGVFIVLQWDGSVLRGVNARLSASESQTHSVFILVYPLDGIQINNSLAEKALLLDLFQNSFEDVGV